MRDEASAPRSDPLAPCGPGEGLRRDEESMPGTLEGYVHPDFWLVARTFRKQIPRRRRGGAAICVYHRGQCVVDMWAGTCDEAGTPWQEDTVSLSYSTTKGVISTLLHVLVDRDALDYDERVSRYWPEFAQAGKEEITVRQLLCHEAGLYDIRGMIDHARCMLDWTYMIDALERCAPAHPPGETHGYHGLTYGWLVGELIQRVTGRPLREVLRCVLAEPLGLDGLFVGVDDSQRSRRATLMNGRLSGGMGASSLVRRAEIVSRGLKASHIPFDLAGLESALMPRGIESLDFNSDDVVGAVIPAVNGIFTARSLARMYAALVSDGGLDGVRLLSPETLARATEVQNRRMGRVIPLPMHWRLGYHRVPAVRSKVPRGFGHFGFGGSGAWADPERQLAVALVLNSGVGTSFGDTRIIRAGSAALVAADRR